MQSRLNRTVFRYLNASSVPRPKLTKHLKSYREPAKKAPLDPFPLQLFNPQQLTRQRANPRISEAAPKDGSQQNLNLDSSKPLARDFIHDSLYNPKYGYFSQRAVIFSQPDPVDFARLNGMEDFEKCISNLYRQYDEFQEEDALQVWHTPTELFKPWYGYAVGRYILEQYLANDEWQRTGQPLSIYEMGAGNGTLMCNILEYLKANAPADVYRSLKYNIIEISKQLSQRQEWNNMSRLSQQASEYDVSVNIINKSIFEWDTPITDHCFFVAFEVIDNFAHDVIRYNLSTSETGIDYLAPLQTRIVSEETGDYSEEYEIASDPLIRRYLDLRNRTSYETPVMKNSSSMWTRLKSRLPFTSNLSSPEFIPTMQLYFMEVLRDKFPKHNLILSDFDSLPTEVEGVDSPVVQTRQRHRMVPCTTYLVTPGWFDIFFPTNFELMSDIYGLLMKDANMHKHHSVMSHKDFMLNYANLDKTRTKLGDVPIVDYYQNVAFLLTNSSDK